MKPILKVREPYSAMSFTDAAGGSSHRHQSAVVQGLSPRNRRLRQTPLRGMKTGDANGNLLPLYRLLDTLHDIPHILIRHIRPRRQAETHLEQLLLDAVGIYRRNNKYTSSTPRNPRFQGSSPGTKSLLLTHLPVSTGIRSPAGARLAPAPAQI